MAKADEPTTTTPCSICFEDNVSVFKLPCCSSQLCNSCLCQSTVDQVSRPQCSVCKKKMTASQNSLLVQYSLTVCSHDGWRYEPSMDGCSNPECADFHTPVFGSRKRSHKGVQKRFHEFVTLTAIHVVQQPEKGVFVKLSKKHIFGYGSGVTLPVDTFFFHATGEVSAVSQNQLVRHTRNTPIWAPPIPSIQCETLPLVRPDM